MARPGDRIGQQIGAYVLEKMLGRGGMSVVFFARHRTTGQAAAVKILQRGLPENIVAARRLEQEARTIARIDHPHVVRVFESGRTPDGLPFIAMEFLEGEPLSKLFERQRPMPVPRMLHIARQMLSALTKAHALDIIHRDIKPDNVFLIRRGAETDFVKMLDFGIAKLLGPQPYTAVESVQGVVLGTPEYLPPEIAMDLKICPASDVYAVGVILFEGLTGRLPFMAAGPAELAEHHCFTPPPRPRTFNEDLSPELERVILRCLAKDPNERYRSAEALLAALRPFLNESQEAPTVANRPILFAGPGTSGEREAVDRLDVMLRQAIEARTDKVPAAVVACVAALDDLRGRAEGLEVERLQVEAQLAEEAETITAQEQALLEALSESEALGEEIRTLREELREERARAVEDDLATWLKRVLEDPDGHGLDAIASGDGRDRLKSWLMREGEFELAEEARTSLANRIEELIARRARLSNRCARLEADLLLGRATEASARSMLKARLDALQVELDGIRQRRARLIGRSALLLTRR